MTVSVSKPSLNLREELSALKKNSGVFGERALQSMDGHQHNALTQNYTTPLPYWENLNTDVGQSNSNTFIDEGNRRFYAQNGNNGSTGRCRMHGVLRGQFEVHYECSYQWGWSGITLIPESNMNFDTNTMRNSNGVHVHTFNNSSNNLCYAYYISAPGYPYQSTTSLTGYSSGLFKVWRNNSGVVYFRPPNGTDYATITTNEPLYVVNQPQSPTWVRLNAVINKP